MAWIDFNQIQDDLVALINGGSTGAELVKKEADERDYAFNNMPLVDVRLTDSDPEVRSGRDYFVDTTFEVQVTTYDLSDFADAATLRQSVITAIVDLIRNNANFSASIESSVIGAHTFSSAKDEQSGAFMAAGTVQVVVKTFVDA